MFSPLLLSLLSSFPISLTLNPRLVHARYMYLRPTAINQGQAYLPQHHGSSLMTSPSSLIIPNLSPWSLSQGSDKSSHTSYTQFSSPRERHHQGSLSENDGSPTPVLSPSLRQGQMKDTVTMSDETRFPRAYDTAAHEPIHMPVNLSLYPNMQYPGQIINPIPLQNLGPNTFFQPSKRQERIARLRTRIQQNRGLGMEFGSIPQPLPRYANGWPPPPRFVWCFRSHDVAKNREPWRAFVPQNQALLWQYPGHDIHNRDPSIGRGMKVITVAADRGIAYHNDPDMRAPQTFEVQLLDMAQRPVVWEPLPSPKR